MINGIDALGITGRVAGSGAIALPAAGTAATTAAYGDQVAISPRGREIQAVREKVRDNQEIREALVREMKKKMAQNPFPAGAVADIIAEKIINGWGVISQR